MARFRFRLQAVLDHRGMIEEEKQRAVAVLERERVRLEEMIRERHRAILHEKQEQRAQLAAGDVRGAGRQSAAAAQFMASAQRAAVELAGVLKRLERARAELLEAAKARKAVDLLRERQLEEWRHAQDRREAAAADELAVMRAARRGEQ